MSRTTATTVLIVSALVLLFAVLTASVRTSTDGDPRADLVGAARPEPPLAPMRTVPLPPIESDRIEAAPQRPGAVPTRVRIPDIGVDASVVAVGLEPDGAMELPGASEVGWYEPTRVLPGADTGSSVFAAHVDFGGERGPFFDLRKLAEGADVLVTGADGTELRFRITERFQVDKDELPMEELFRTAGPPTLTLITCGGLFDQSVRHYEDNIVVRAVPV